ncbi:hypothetical protein QFC21_005409 [Naganishia friedmannii]|uniref:Uncharacterized protein n=1 Tax=Naganishia friedmannii TaxID=89922 RepID=A0ACC2VAM3_9TREE|nr:hypothetical protein QFC21_005409 [Naganishia friedmannii]
MGNDGGSIPYRIDLVKNKVKEEKQDEKALSRALWLFCALSKRPLTVPVVADPLGKLYNKDAIIEYLLDRSTYGDGDQICGYVKGVKDLINLNLTPNPALSGSPPHQLTNGRKQDSADLPTRSPFICPLTMKEPTGALPFGCIKSCGCVFSEGGIRAVVQSETNARPTEDAHKAETSPNPEMSIPCPNCSEPFCPKGGFGNDGTGSEWWLPLNPKKEAQELMLANLLAKRAEKKANSKKKDGKDKKRKSQAVGADGVNSTTPDDEPPLAKRNKSVAVQHTMNMSSKVQQELTALEAKRKAGGQSEAVKSIYGDGRGLRAEKNDFFTRTFNRYA